MKQKSLRFENTGFCCGPLFEHKRLSKNNRRRKAHNKKMQQATPRWLSLSDRQKMNSFWEQSKQLTRATGFQHSVDHIVPLSHPAVCGLHVPWNLEVMLFRDNIAKSNNHWPDMWSVQGKLI